MAQTAVALAIFLLATGLGVFLIAYGVVVMARITSVYPILSLSKVSGAVIPASWMNTATLGGMRGALATVLVSAVPPTMQAPVATLTFGVVMLSILLQGPLLTRYTKRAFGRQETLQSFDTYGSIYDMDKGAPPTQALSPDDKERGTDEFR